MVRIPRVSMKSPKERVKTGIALSAGALIKAKKSPDEAFGELFRDVQQRNVLGDGKTFVDLVPRKRARAIKQEYSLSKQDPDFNLHEFINRHFYEFEPHKQEEQYTPNADTPVDEHIKTLWGKLKRRNRRDRGSLLTLPHTYIVPGGRFGEQFYWDSYFIMLGLAAEGKWHDIQNMMKNYRYMIRKYGFIPTANRSYFLSRSQPPVFVLMVHLLAKHKGEKLTYLEYLPYLLAEYRWWMKGRTKLSKQEHKAFARLVEMSDGSLMNRYYDNKTTPRPESLREDEEAAKRAEGREADRLYLHLRAAAESGWDFSSRWLRDPKDIRTIHTADIVPVDLNSLLYELERTISYSYGLMKNQLLANKFKKLADKRAKAINKYCWSEERQMYVDYNFHHFKETPHATLAMVFPLYVGIASQHQADATAKHLENDFLKNGGLITTLIDSGQQWDAPNGWAPLHWVAIQGLRRYGHNKLASEIKQRWVKRNLAVYDSQRKLIEKYNVEDTTGLGSGGEYPLQDGFGWTNGVLEALLAEDSQPAK